MKLSDYIIGVVHCVFNYTHERHEINVFPSSISILGTRHHRDAAGNDLCLKVLDGTENLATERRRGHNIMFLPCRCEVILPVIMHAQFSKNGFH